MLVKSQSFSPESIKCGGGLLQSKTCISGERGLNIYDSELPRLENTENCFSK